MRWPSRDEVDAAARRWAEHLAEAEADVVAVGYFGSYARGDAGVGSDLDLVVLVREGGGPDERRGGRWATEHLPVPAECLPYTLEQWQRLRRCQPRFFRMLSTETVWVRGEPPEDRTIR